MVAEPAVPTTAMREMNERAEALATKLANKAVDGAAPAPMGHGCFRPANVAPVAPMVTVRKEPAKIVTREVQRQVPHSPPQEKYETRDGLVMVVPGQEPKQGTTSAETSRQSVRVDGSVKDFLEDRPDSADRG